MHRWVSGVVGFDNELIRVVVSKGVGAHITFQRISVVTARGNVSTAISAAAASTAVGIILIAVVCVHITRNSGNRTETALPDGERLGVSGTIHAVMGDPVIVLIQSGAGKAAVEQGRRAVKSRRISGRCNCAAKCFHNTCHGCNIHVAMSRSFNVVKDRIIQLTVIQNIKTEFRFLFCHFRSSGVAEVIHADGNVVGYRSRVILFKAGVHLIGPVFAAVACADDGEINLAAFCHRVPVDCFLIIGNINSHQGNMDLTAGIASIRQISGYG